MIRLLTKADAKILGVAFTSTTSKSEAFITTYEEAVRQENPLERVASNLHPTVVLHLVLLIMKIV